MFKRWLRRNRPAPARRVPPHAEWLEPRLLFSADLAAGWLPAPVTPQDQEVRTLSAQGEYARAAQPQSVAQAYVTTALNFEKNVGQANRDLDFIASGSGYTIALSDGDADIVLAGAAAPVHLELVGGRDEVKAKGEGLLDARSSYLLGNDKGKWLTDIANYRAVLYEDVYRGVDVRYYGTQRQLEYDFIVAAGADASQIRLRFDGAEARLDARGNLLLRTPEGRDITFDAPVSYQQGPNGREAVTSGYRLHADGSVGIQLGSYDRSRELVIDPVLSYASYFGESGDETGVDVAVDAAGKVYVTGSTDSTGGILGTLLGGLFGTSTVDTYVAKFNADLSVLEWTARVGGNREDRPTAMAVDAAGSVVVTGYTTSTNFATSGAADTTLGGDQDAFVYRLNTAGNALIFASYFGDTANGDRGNGVALDGSGNIYVTGAASGAIGGGTDAFVARYSPGGALQLQFKYGGGNTDTGNDIAVDATGHIYVVGDSRGGAPAMLGGHQTGRAGGAEGFLARFDPTGTLVYGTYIGGDEEDTAVAVTVGGDGRAYVVGRTQESDESGFQLTAGAWNTSRVSAFSGYLRIYDTDLRGAASLMYSTLVRGNGPNDEPIGVALRGDVVIVLTDGASPGFAVTTDALKSTHSPGTLHLAAIHPGGAGAGDLVWGSYYGNGVTGGGLAVGGGSIYVAGSTGANGLATPGAADTTRSGDDAIVGRISLANDPPVLTGFNGPSMFEDQPGNGFTVLSLITGKLTDTNTGAVLGIAITGSTSAGGTWHYSLNGGTDWTALGTPTPAAALLLSADSLTRLRFTPAANYNGNGATLTFRGWDRTSGLEGRTADASSGGGSSAFSLAEATAPITVTAVNDRPERTAGAVADLALAEGAAATSLGLGGLAYDAGGNGTEAGQNLTYTVTNVPTGSFGRIVLADGTTVVQDGTAYTLAQLRGMQFIAGTATSGSQQFAFTVVDDGTGDNTLAQSLTITITNAAPVLHGSNPLPVIAEDSPLADNTGVLVSDLIAGQVTDPTTFRGIAVVGASSANGVWQYRRSDSDAWQAFGTADASNAVLLAADGDARVRFVAAAGWSGTDTGLVFRAWDGTGDTTGDTTGHITVTGGSSPYSAATATASVTVTPVNDAPVAPNVSASTLEGAASLALVLGGSDIDGTIASITLGALPAAQGKLYTDSTLRVEATPGTYAGSTLTLYFVPAADFHGTAGFNYTVSDNHSATAAAPGTVSITVTAVNDAPVASGATASGAEGAASIPITLGGTDIDGTVQVVTLVSLPPGAHGKLYTDATLQVAATPGDYAGSALTLYFVPAPDFNGNATFTFTVSDEHGLADGSPATATIAVAAVNDAPVAAPGGASGNEDAASIAITLSAADVDNAIDGYTLLSLPANGSLYINAACTMQATIGTLYRGVAFTFHFVPDSDFNGTPTFGFTATDVLGLASAPQVATITVTAVNDAPTASVAAASGIEDGGAIAITLGGTDVDGVVQSITLSTLPTAAQGKLYTDATLLVEATLGTYAGNTLTLYFVPAQDFNGNAAFTFAVSDDLGLAAASPATATIAVAAVNDAPVATPASASGNEDARAIAVTLHASDVDHAIRGYTLASLPADGLLYTNASLGTLAAAGTLYTGASVTLYFVPASNFNGTASFGFTASDTAGLASGVETATITVAAVNDAPVQTGGTVADITVIEGGTASLGLGGISFAVGGNGDEAAQSLTYTVTAVPPGAFGRVLLADGTVVAAGHSYTLAQLEGMRFAAGAGVTAGSASFAFTARDNGGTAHGGNDLLQRSLAITVRNQAPVLAGTNALPSLLEDATADAGMLVADLVAGRISDPSNAFGIAVVAASSPNGTWEFSSDGGRVWSSLAAASPSDARLLAADSLTRVRFVPAPDWNGTASGLAFRAWDGSGGTAGAAAADARVQGGATPFSASMATASVVVIPVNDAPIAPVAPVVMGDATQQRIDLGLDGLAYAPGRAADEDGQLLRMIVTRLPPASLGTLYLADGVTAVQPGTAYAMDQLRGMHFVPAAGSEGGSVDIAYLLRDDGGTDGGGVDRSAGVLQLRIGRPAFQAVPTAPSPGGPDGMAAPAPAPSQPQAPLAGAAPAPAPATGGRGPAPQAATGDALVESAAPSTLLPAASGMSFSAERRVIPLDSVRPAIGLADRPAVQPMGFTGTGADFQVLGFSELYAGGARLTLEQLQQTLRSDAFVQQMDKLRDGMQQEFDLDRTVSISVAGVSLGLSVAYVLWLVRGGVLVGSYLSALPAWRLLDPLPVLAHAGGEEEDEEDEPLDAREGATPADPLRGFA